MKKNATAFLGVLLVAYLLFELTPKTRLGDAFFGDVQSLYNVGIAQLFYEGAVRFDREDGVAPPYAYYQLSRTYFIQGDFDTALAYAYKELEHHPSHLHTYYIIGLTLGYMDREEEAIEAFGKFIEYKPESWAARNDKAWLHFRIGDIDGGLDTIIPAAQAHPENPWVMNTFGVLLMNEGQYATAENALRQALLSAETMTEADWGMAYPGNAPEIYGTGLEAMRTSIRENLDTVIQKQSEVVQSL
jgi:tetratricopeptide (TPR) repeat protein